MNLFKVLLASSLLVTSLAGCVDEEPVIPARYEQSDTLVSQIEANVLAAKSLNKVVIIDHSRLGQEAGSVMPPAKVLIFSNPALETTLVKENPLIAIDLPLRVLAYETEPGGDSKVIFNSIDYIESRYGLSSSSVLVNEFSETMALALDGIETHQLAYFEQNDMQPDGITTIDSPFEFQTTVDKVKAAIDSQDDTVSFGSIDFQAQAFDLGVEVKPMILILFGGPAPGAKAMSNAPTLGLDAFCQKFLIWQDNNDQVHLSFNNLPDLAERQDVSKSVALRVINYRLNKVFEDALSD